MSVYYMRPISDDKAQWTSVPGGAAWSILNAPVTETDTPDTSTNYVEAPTGGGSVNRQYLAVPAIAPYEMITQITGYWYLRTATTGQTVDYSLVTEMSATGSFLATAAAGTAYGWVSAGAAIGFNIPDMSQIPMEALRLARLNTATTGVASAGTARVADQFIKVTTVSMWSPRRMPMA